ncbi:MAG: tRNA uridine-5-carboxymethylaminomethyl(34) synthesis GTPase MnmE [Erysipelotrichaceae bacterium]
MLNDVIAAIATANADGAISVIRLSGDYCIELVNGLFTKDLMEVPSHTIHYGFIQDPTTKQQVDEVLVSVFRAPKTFTRDDVVEINTHGGYLVTNKVLQLCLSHGARLAMPGEFTKRAFINGRIDLTQAEAIDDLIHAQSDANLTVALQGIKGSVKVMLEPLIQNLLDIIANIEVNIDYPEYDDVEQLTSTRLIPNAKQWIQEIDQILDKARSGQIVRDGIKTAIVGKPNVGKSSLLNALLEEERAIVTNIEGTTRDVVEGSMQLGSVRLRLMDTAGIRESDDVVEQIGIQRSIQAMEDADLVLLVLDPTRIDAYDEELLERTKDKERLIIYNKKDLMAPDNEHVWISAAQGEIQPLLDALGSIYHHHLRVLDEPALNNERQIALMIKAKHHMQIALDAMQLGFELDLVAIDLQEVYTSLKEILGKVHKDDLLDTLFSNFCLGK